MMHTAMAASMLLAISVNAMMVRMTTMINQAAHAILGTCYKACVWGPTEHIISEIISYKRDHIKAKTGLAMDQIPYLGIFNNSAPCLQSTLANKGAYGIIAWMMAENLNSVCPVICPVFSWHKGKVSMEEKAMLESLEEGNTNLDQIFFVPFKDKVDGRDDRPMKYAGRLLLPSPMDPKKGIWANCELRKEMSTDIIKQMHEKNMYAIEDC